MQLSSLLGVPRLNPKFGSLNIGFDEQNKNITGVEIEADNSGDIFINNEHLIGSSDDVAEISQTLASEEAAEMDEDELEDARYQLMDALENIDYNVDNEKSLDEQAETLSGIGTFTAWIKESLYPVFEENEAVFVAADELEVDEQSEEDDDGAENRLSFSVVA